MHILVRIRLGSDTFQVPFILYLLRIRIPKYWTSGTQEWAAIVWRKEYTAFVYVLMYVYMRDMQWLDKSDMSLLCTGKWHVADPSEVEDKSGRDNGSRVLVFGFPPIPPGPQNPVPHVDEWTHSSTFVTWMILWSFVCLRVLTI